MKKRVFRSLKSNIILFLIIVFFLLACMIFYNNYAAFRLLRRKVYSNTQDILRMYQKNLDENLNQTETWIRVTATINRTEEVNTLKSASIQETAWFQAQYALTRDFQSALSVYPVGSFFCWLPGDGRFFQSYNTDSSTANAVRDFLTGLLEKEEAQTNEWFLGRVGGNYYFIYCYLCNNGVCLGTWVSMEQLQNDLLLEESENQLCFVSDDYCLLQDQADPVQLKVPAEEDSSYELERLEQGECLCVFQPLSFAPLFLAALVPASDLTDNYYSLYVAAAVVGVGAAVLGLALYLILDIQIRRPVSDLTAAIGRLRSGDLATSVSIRRQPEEFIRLSSAFNEMVSEIKDLKIDVYERKIRHQKLEMQYLKQQITPHFMINCLNTAYQLTEIEQPELARSMLRALSRHLRYTLSSGQTTALREELALLGNYIELSEIRYPGCIAYYEDCPDELLNATAIPLLLLNFVENTIKYEISMGDLLEIHVEISKFQKDEAPWLHICIWDTGNGFAEDFLERLQDIEQYAEAENEHIGIVNVYLRARHVYRELSFHFENREGAGAQITMELPFIPFQDTHAEKESGEQE